MARCCFAGRNGIIPSWFNGFLNNKTPFVFRVIMHRFIFDFLQRKPQCHVLSLGRAGQRQSRADPGQGGGGGLGGTGIRLLSPQNYPNIETALN
jgi:hypothetical protein